MDNAKNRGGTLGSRAGKNQNEPDVPPKEAAAEEAAPAITLQVALAVNQGCQMILGTPAPAAKKFVWALMRNRDRLKSVVTSYEESRQNLLKRFAETTANGQVVAGPNDQAKFKNKKSEEAFYKELGELLQMDADVEFYKISFDDVPENISAAAFSLLEPIIIDGSD